MKKLFLLFILCITTIATKAQSGDAKGEWSGQLNVFGQKLTLVFLLNDENCTLDSPDQGVKGVPAKLERTETGIKVSVSSINASYEGVNKGDSITGTFTAWGVISTDPKTGHDETQPSADTRRSQPLPDTGGEFQ